MAHFTLLMVSAFRIWLAPLEVASVVLVPVAKSGLIRLSSQTKCTICNNQPLYINAERFGYDNYQAISAFILLSYMVGLLRSWVNITTFFGCGRD